MQPTKREICVKHIIIFEQLYETVSGTCRQEGQLSITVGAQRYQVSGVCAWDKRTDVDLTAPLGECRRMHGYRIPKNVHKLRYATTYAQQALGTPEAHSPCFFYLFGDDSAIALCAPNQERTIPMIGGCSTVRLRLAFLFCLAQPHTVLFDGTSDPGPFGR